MLQQARGAARLGNLLEAICTELQRQPTRCAMVHGRLLLCCTSPYPLNSLSLCWCSPLGRCFACAMHAARHVGGQTVNQTHDAAAVCNMASVVT